MPRWRGECGGQSLDAKGDYRVIAGRALPRTAVPSALSFFVFSIITDRDRYTASLYRCLIMGLSHQSAHPCPLWLILRVDIYALGSRHDTNNRFCKARIDDEDYVRLVKRSRKNMFENGDVLEGRT